MPSRTLFTDLDVINQAFTGLGEQQVLSDLQSEESVAAIAMRTHYAAVKEFCLTKTNWRFNTSKVALSKLSGAPLNRWSAAWQLPADHLKTLYLWPPQLYEIQGQRLYINEGTRVHLDYQRNLEEPLWPAWFVRLVVAELIIRTCRPITGGPPDQEMKDERRAAESEAYFQDAQQQPNQTILPNEFIDVRA